MPEEDMGAAGFSYSCIGFASSKDIVDTFSIIAFIFGAIEKGLPPINDSLGPLLQIFDDCINADIIEVEQGISISFTAPNPDSFVDQINIRIV